MSDQIFERSDALRRQFADCSEKYGGLIFATAPNRGCRGAPGGNLLSICWPSPNARICNPRKQYHHADCTSSRSADASSRPAPQDQRWLLTPKRVVLRPPKLASDSLHSEPLHEYTQFIVRKIRR